MPRRKKSPLDELISAIMHFPPTLGLILIAFIFFGLRYAVPYVFQPAAGDPLAKTLPGKVVGTACYQFAPIFTGLLLLVWVAGLIRRLFNRRQLDAQTGLDSIRQLSWQQFETLLATCYERQGYDVEHTGSNGPDGGVNLRLRKDNQLTLVQCKHWHAHSVGVKPLRELQGLVAAQNAARGVLVTSGEFTADANREFENNRAIDRIDGDQLAQIIRDAQSASPRASGSRAEAKPPAVNAAPPCPTCQSPMVERTAKKGPDIGGKFWGCPKFPGCRGKREMAG